jgi:hypothetical protein
MDGSYVVTARPAQVMDLIAANLAPVVTGRRRFGGARARAPGSAVYGTRRGKAQRWRYGTWPGRRVSMWERLEEGEIRRRGARSR